MTAGLTLISINTVPYSSKCTPAPSCGGSDPYGQFAWLRLQLDVVRASGRHAYLVGHIPPVLDSYFSVGSTPNELWTEAHQQAFYAVVEEYNDVIVAQLFGHLHTNEFRLPLRGARMSSAILLHSAVTPVYGNNPTFSVVEYDNVTGALLDQQVGPIQTGAEGRRGLGRRGNSREGVKLSLLAGVRHRHQCAVHRARVPPCLPPERGVSGHDTGLRRHSPPRLQHGGERVRGGSLPRLGAKIQQHREPGGYAKLPVRGGVVVVVGGGERELIECHPDGRNSMTATSGTACKPPPLLLTTRPASMQPRNAASVSGPAFHPCLQPTGKGSFVGDVLQRRRRCPARPQPPL